MNNLCSVSEGDESYRNANVGQRPSDQCKGGAGSGSLKDDQSRNLKMGCLSKDVRRGERARLVVSREQNWLRQSEGEGCQLSLRLKTGTTWEVAKLNNYKPMDSFTSVNQQMSPTPGMALGCGQQDAVCQ